MIGRESENDQMGCNHDEEDEGEDKESSQRARLCKPRIICNVVDICDNSLAESRFRCRCEKSDRKILLVNRRRRSHDDGRQRRFFRAGHEGKICVMNASTVGFMKRNEWKKCTKRSRYKGVVEPLRKAMKAWPYENF